MNKAITILLLLIFLSGCATGKVVQTGKDNYMITGCTSTPFSKGDTVLAKLYEIGNKYCIGKNKQLNTVKTECGNWAPFVRWSTAELTFMCLDASDPRLKTNGDVNNTLEDKLQKLSKLLSDGLITKNEFEEQKKKLLNDFTSQKN